MMDCTEVILSRRSIRQYQARQIPQQILEDVMEAALAAPSAVNYQPWYFVVVKNPAAIERFSSLMTQAAQKVKPVLEERFPNHPDVVAETYQFISELGGAPVCVLTFQYEKEYKKSESTIIQSVSAAIENLLLAAWSKGIGSCWMTAPLEAGLSEELRREFAPDHGELVAMVTLGYPEKFPMAPRRKKGRYIII